jgi:hypothetical protein
VKQGLPGRIPWRGEVTVEECKADNDHTVCVTRPYGLGDAPNYRRRPSRKKEDLRNSDHPCQHDICRRDTIGCRNCQGGRCGARGFCRGNGGSGFASSPRCCSDFRARPRGHQGPPMQPTPPRTACSPKPSGNFDQVARAFMALGSSGECSESGSVSVSYSRRRILICSFGSGASESSAR